MVSLDHSIRSRQHIRRNGEADLLVGFEIDHKLEFRRLLYCQLSRVRSFQDFIHISCGTPIQIDNADSVGDKPANISKISPVIYCWKPAFYRKFNHPCSRSIEDGARQHNHSVGTPLSCLPECSLNIVRSSDVQVLKLHFERRCGKFDLSERLGITRIGGGSEDSKTRQVRKNFLQKLQPFSA